MQVTTRENNIYFLHCNETIYYLFFWILYYCDVNNESNILFSKFIQKLPQNKIIEGKSRVISSTHAIVLSFFSTLYLIKIIDYNYWKTFLPICSSFGIFDLSLITINYSIFKKNYNPTLIHHGLLIFGPLLVTPENSYIMAQSFLFEITVPLIDSSWYLYHTNQKETKLFKVNASASILSFFIFRIINNIHILFTSFEHSYTFQTVTFLFLCLNIYWFSSLLKLVFKFT